MGESDEGDNAGGVDGTTVRVATRIRPQLPREIIDACKVCITKTPGEPQAWLGANKAFTFDYVYDADCSQQLIYEETVDGLVEGCFEGYNATVLAYGQTGSGKTYTMGTGFELATSGGSGSSDHLGIIPRAVRQLFQGIRQRQEEARERGRQPPEFKVSTQFMELYNEEILDLFDAASCGGAKIRGNSKSGIRIHEDANGNIYTVGVTTRAVQSEEETMQCLKSGAFNRTTASTNMNDQSSRSHAIFTIYVQQQRQSLPEDPFHLNNGEEKENQTVSGGDLETLSAKFHFVDLAGSERLKRTGATGDRAKEGIAINCGLLALGNVISALGDVSRKVSHVPYRDSKLTRLLQDSLGGNSRTLMIACVSPSDRDFMETLNTLKYANRARNIKNKVTANQDKTSRTIMALRQEIQNLQLELTEYRQGKRVVGEDGTETTNDMFHENSMLGKENQNLRTRIKAMQETIDVLTAKNSQLLAEKEVGNWITLNGEESGVSPDMTAMVQGYLKEIEELRAKLCESENLCEQLRRETARVRRVSAANAASPAKFGFGGVGGIMDMSVDEDGYSVQELIQMAKKDVEKSRKEKRRKTSQQTNKVVKIDEDKDANSADDENDEEEDEEDVEEGSDDNSDSEDDEEESSNKEEEINEELVDITAEISIKQKLIEELETSQKRLQAMKSQYENKLMALQNKIAITEEERDKVLKSMGSSPGAKSGSAPVPPEKVQKIKQEYKDKLEKLQVEVKKLQAAKREHAKLLRSQTQYERQVEKLRNEVADMKRNKVKLVQKMKEESARHREQETRRNKELTQMRKLTRKNESKIKSLEAEKRMKENILKRKNEEVTALRRHQRKTSSTRRGSVNQQQAPYSERQAKSKWHAIEKKITKVALNRQAISQMENDMDRWLREREKLSRRLERMATKRKRLAAEKGDSTLVEDLDDQIENLKANVSYLHDNIVECQQNIVEMEQAGNLVGDEEADQDEEAALVRIVNVGEIGLDEARYLLGKMLSMTVNQCCQATQREARVKELEQRIGQITHQSTLHQQLLQHMIEQQDLEIYDLMLAGEQGEEDSDDDEVEDSDQDDQPITMNLNHLDVVGDDFGSDSSSSKRDKARRKMTTKEDLLFNDTDVMPVSPAINSAKELMPPPSLSSSSGSNTRGPFLRSLSFTKPSSDLMFRSRSFVKPSSSSGLSNGRHSQYQQYLHGINQQRLTNSNDIMTQSVDQSVISRLAPVYQPSPMVSRRHNQRSSSPKPANNLRKFNSAARLNDENNASSPPGSPPPQVFRRVGSVREESGRNVFHRLVAGTRIGEASNPSKGVILDFKGGRGGGGSNSIPRNSGPLMCVGVAEGHHKAVLSVAATDSVLLTGSKDRTVKVWDLTRKEEIQSLSGHPNNVSVVKYVESSKLAFSVSTAFVKVWDLRMPGASCIKTLSSSGLTTNGPVQTSLVANRTLSLPPGEALINDIALSPSGNSLFSAAGDKVRVWDLRKFHSIGKLSGGHQAAVMCLTADDNNNGGDDDMVTVVTGSKDHYVKVFRVCEGRGGVVSPAANLDPPHYDGVESLALRRGVLFTASRDTCIKKWTSLSHDGSFELVRSINNAHKDWICGLSFMPGGQTLVSGCRAGYLKLWNARTCAQIGGGETKAHNSTINAIDVIDAGLVFTASNDGSIGMWRVRPNFEESASPHDSEEGGTPS